MFDLLITGMIVDPIEGVREGAVLIQGARIAKVAGALQEAIPAKRKIHLDPTAYLFPGFIDPHVHLREPGWEYKEDFYTGSLAAAAGGVTTVGDMPNLPTPITTKQALLEKVAAAKKAVIDVIHFGGAGKNAQEISLLSPLVKAFKLYTAESTGSLTVGGWPQIEEATRLISSLGKPITFHCEDHDINANAREALREAQYPSKHCDERPPESETSAVEKVLSFCQKYRTRANIAHLSTKESVRLVGECKSAFPLTAEAAPHHLFFRRDDMDVHGPFLKVNPPLRKERDRRALLKGLREGAVDMLATDHAPHTREEKNSASPPSGMPGLDTYGNVVLWLMVEQKFSPERIAEITSCNAARFLGLPDRGRVREGFLADLTILDTQGSTRIVNSGLKTKCKWSPFHGREFPGRVIATISRGKVLQERVDRNWRF